MMVGKGKPRNLDGLPVEILGESMRFRQAKYREGKTALEIMMEDGERFMVLTINLPQYNHLLAEDEIFVKGWSENEEYIDDVYSSGYFEDTGRQVPSGWVYAAVWRIKEEDPTVRYERARKDGILL